MRPAQKARRLLKGHWAMAVAVQCIGSAAWMLIILAELAVLRVTHLGAETVVHVTAMLDGKWVYGAVTVGMLILDWLLLSPLLLGRMLFYWKIALGEDVSYTLLFTFYRRRYGKALYWRLSLFLRRLMWNAVCYLPAALVMGYAELIRRSGSDTPLADITLLLCTLSSFLLLLAGFLISEMLMLRYLPAAYILAMDQEEESHKVFRLSCHMMRGHVGELLWLYIGFAGWLVSCVLLFPYYYASPLFQTTRASAVRRYMAEAAKQAQQTVRPVSGRRAAAKS